MAGHQFVDFALRETARLGDACDLNLGGGGIIESGAA
jgi:hypothetical protein